MMDGGGPAFPIMPYDAGMSLRDYFAAHALPMAWKAERERPTNYVGAEGPTYKGAAERAYLFADAMLAEREREK